VRIDEQRVLLVEVVRIFDCSSLVRMATGPRAGLTLWREFGLVSTVLIVAGAIFWLAPWSLEEKSQAALHGLCAQRPSHSFMLGDRSLPFDARMTGIYGGFLVTTLFLALRHRFRSFKLPPRPVIALLTFFVGAMAIDGSNSLLVDLGLGHPYHPRNTLRLLTGSVTGIALATLICFLISSTLWRRGRVDLAPLQGSRELGFVVLLQVPFVAAVLSGAPALYVPLVILLLSSAVLVVAAIMLVVVVLIQGREATFDSMSSLQRPAAIALILALAVMAAFSGGRALLEEATGSQPLLSLPADAEDCCDTLDVTLALPEVSIF